MIKGGVGEESETPKNRGNYFMPLKYFFIVENFSPYLLCNVIMYSLTACVCFERISGIDKIFGGMTMWTTVDRMPKRFLIWKYEQAEAISFMEAMSQLRVMDESCRL